MPDFKLMQGLAVHRERVAARRLAQRDGISVAVALEKILREATNDGELDQLLEIRRQQALRLDEIKHQKKALAQQKHRLKIESKKPPQASWCAWFDGSAKPNPGACAIGAVLLAPDGRRWEISQTIGYGNSSTAEYQALLALLVLMRKQACQHAVIYGDSRVVIDDLYADTIHSAQSMTEYRLAAREIIQHLPGLQIVWIPRAKNQTADALAELAFSRQIHAIDDVHGMNLSGKFVDSENSLQRDR